MIYEFFTVIEGTGPVRAALTRHQPLQWAPRCASRSIVSTLKATWALLIFTSMVLPAPALAIHRSFAPEAKNWTAGAFYGTQGTFFADVTGDGKADAIAVNNDRVWVRRSDGCSFRPNEPWTQTPFYGTIATFFADVTGDRKADAIAVNNDGIVVRRSEDGRRAKWTTAFYGDLATSFADVTGDEMADAIAVDSSGITVRRSNGTTFGPTETWTELYYGSRGTYFADVTGDRCPAGTPPRIIAGVEVPRRCGRADAIAVDDANVRVSRSVTSPFTFKDEFRGNENWTPDPYYGNLMNFFADATGDRRADAIVVNDDGIAVRDSMGDGFRTPDPTTHRVESGDLAYRAWGYWTRDPYYGTRGTFFADVNGDNAVDAIAVNDDGVYVRRSRYVDFFGGQCP